MPFTERNESWTGNLREFRQVFRSGTPRVWRISVEGNRIHTSWGQLGGAMQQATEVMPGINIGKKNEKSPAQYAIERARESCRKKHWEGYREFHNDQPIDEIEDNKIDFDNLPLNLSFYKPDNTMNAGMMKKALAGEVVYTRKRNGLAFILCKGSDIPHLYSRRMLRQHDNETDTPFTWDDRFPHIIEAADQIMAPNSILLGELVMDRDGKDDMSTIQSYTKSLTPQAIEEQFKHGLASFYIWDVAFWNGIDMLKNTPVGARHTFIEELWFDVPPAILDTYGKFVMPLDTFCFQSPEEATEFAKKMGWEGFVVVDPEGVYGDKAYNFKGKPDRPRASCAKLKPDYEDDFIVKWDPDNGIGERSTKARNGLGIRSVALYQYNSKGEEVYIANLGVGLTDEMRRDLADPKLFPRVWKVVYKDRRYTSKGDDTNALDFASFEEERTDKYPEDCVNPEL